MAWLTVTFLGGVEVDEEELLLLLAVVLIVIATDDDVSLLFVDAIVVDSIVLFEKILNLLVDDIKLFGAGLGY